MCDFYWLSLVCKHRQWRLEMFVLHMRSCMHTLDYSPLFVGLALVLRCGMSVGVLCCCNQWPANHLLGLAAGKLVFSFTNSDGTYDKYDAGFTGDLRDNQWHDVMIRFEANKPNGLNYYVDGVLTYSCFVKPLKRFLRV